MLARGRDWSRRQGGIGTLPGVAADALVGVFLHGAQELRLQGQRQFADFV